jgi:hypothetical protein
MVASDNNRRSGGFSPQQFREHIVALKRDLRMFIDEEMPGHNTSLFSESNEVYEFIIGMYELYVDAYKQKPELPKGDLGEFITYLKKYRDLAQEKWPAVDWPALS